MNLVGCIFSVVSVMFIFSFEVTEVDVFEVGNQHQSFGFVFLSISFSASIG